MSPRNEMSRQDEILTVARQEFIKEGYSGARLQSIADNIGVTKAMIHYYFNTKEQLFKAVYSDAVKKVMAGLFEILDESTPVFPKIDKFIDHAIDRFTEQHQLVGFVISELNQHPEKTQSIFQEAKMYNSSVFKDQLQTAAANYEIQPVQSTQVVANMLSLCLFPFSGSLFLKQTLQMNEEEYQEFLDKRREVIKDTIINALAG